MHAFGVHCRRWSNMPGLAISFSKRIMRKFHKFYAMGEISASIRHKSSSPFLGQKTSNRDFEFFNGFFREAKPHKLMALPTSESQDLTKFHEKNASLL